MTLARENLAKGDFDMAQEKVKRARDQFQKILDLPSLPYQALNARAQAKLSDFRQYCISKGDIKNKRVRSMLKDYEASNWQKGLLIRAEDVLNDARKCFKVGFSVDEDRTESKQYDDELASLETKLRTFLGQSNVQTPRQS